MQPPNNEGRPWPPQQPYYPPQYAPPPPPPPKKTRPWLIIAIIVGVIVILGGISNVVNNRQADTTPTPVATSAPTHALVQTPTHPAKPTPTNTPEPKSVYDWHGKGTQKTEIFSMKGTWHIQWFCLGNSLDTEANAQQYLTINLHNADTGSILKTWQHACTADRFDETVKYTGNFQIEGIVTDQTFEYHITVLQ